MSAEKAKAWLRNHISIAHRLFKGGGSMIRQSFRLIELPCPLQLQSYTILMGVVADSFIMGW